MQAVSGAVPLCQPAYSYRVLECNTKLKMSALWYWNRQSQVVMTRDNWSPSDVTPQIVIILAQEVDSQYSKSTCPS